MSIVNRLRKMVQADANAENAGVALFVAYLCLVPASLLVLRWQKMI